MTKRLLTAVAAFVMIAAPAVLTRAHVDTVSPDRVTSEVAKVALPSIENRHYPMTRPLLTH